jgi:hypothetical protein
MKYPLSAWCIAGTFLATLQVGHALPAVESFDYTAAATVTGQTGGSGWSGAWTQDGETGVVRSPGLSFTDSAGKLLTVSGLAMTTAGTATTRNFREITGGPIADVWISFLWNLPASNALFEGVSFYQGTASRFTVSNPGGTAAAGIFLGSVNSGRGTFGLTHLVVLRLRDGAGAAGADLVEMYVDPTLATAPTTPLATVQGADLSFSSIRVAGQNGAALLIDEIRLGATFAEVTPYTGVPDPDPDGDGIVSTDELLLGTDPNVSNLALFNAIRAHPDYFGLYNDASILQATNGGSIRAVTPLSSQSVFFEMQQSTDLLTWLTTETMTRQIVVPAGKSYLRLSIPQP